MKTRLAVLSIIVDNPDSTGALNELLSDFREYIVGRMGIPYKEKGVSVICIVIDAPENLTNTLAGKLGKLDGVNAKINFSGVISDCQE